VAYFFRCCSFAAVRFLPSVLHANGHPYTPSTSMGPGHTLEISHSPRGRRPNVAAVKWLEKSSDVGAPASWRMGDFEGVARPHRGGWGIRMPICMQHRREKLNCSETAATKEICHLFLHFFFQPFLPFFPIVLLENQYQSNLSNQPAIYPSIPVCIYQCIGQGIRQSIHFHRNVRRLYVSSNAKLRTNMPDPPPPTLFWPTPDGDPNSPDSLVSWLLVDARVCTVSLVVVPLFFLVPTRWKRF